VVNLRRSRAEACVRLEHVPTGVRVEAYDERTQESNVELAVKRLRKRLHLLCERLSTHCQT